VAVVSDDSFYILKFDRDAYNAKLEEGVEITDEGVEEAFDVIAEISDRYSHDERGGFHVQLMELLSASKPQNG